MKKLADEMSEDEFMRASLEAARDFMIEYADIEPFKSEVETINKKLDLLNSKLEDDNEKTNS